MAYTNEKDAGHRITSVTFGGTEIKSVLGASIEKIVEREVRQAGSNNTPVSRPVAALDARATIRFLDLNGAVSHTAAAANIVVSFSSDGGTGSVTVGTMLASGVTNTFERGQGGFSADQVFELEGTSLAYTPTI